MAGCACAAAQAGQPVALPEATRPAPTWTAPNTTLTINAASASSPTLNAPPESPTISTERPGFTDGSGITPPGRLVLEFGYTYTFRDRRGVEAQTHNGPEILARVGIIEDRLELRVGTSGYVWSRSNDGTGFVSIEGFSDASVGFKVKIADQNGIMPRLALEGMTTIGLGSRAISNRDLEPTMKVIGTWDLGSGFTLNSNAVVTYATASGERFVQGAGSASLSFAVSEQMSLFVEYFVVGPRSKGTDAAHSMDMGGALLLSKRVQIDARVGFGLNQEADNLFAGAGISFLY